MPQCGSEKEKADPRFMCNDPSFLMLRGLTELALWTRGKLELCEEGTSAERMPP